MEKQMRQIIVVGIAVAAVVAIWGSAVIGGNALRQSVAAPAASPPVNVMQMMKEARNLPDQQFDAH
jgi:hypothetical protein